MKFNFERQIDKASDAYNDGKWALADLFLSNIKIPVTAMDAATVRINI